MASIDCSSGAPRLLPGVSAETPWQQQKAEAERTKRPVRSKAPTMSLTGLASLVRIGLRGAACLRDGYAPARLPSHRARHRRRRQDERVAAGPFCSMEREPHAGKPRASASGARRGCSREREPPAGKPRASASGARLRTKRQRLAAARFRFSLDDREDRAGRR